MVRAGYRLAGALALLALVCTGCARPPAEATGIGGVLVFDPAVAGPQHEDGDAVLEADLERIAAMLAAHRARLEAVLHESLRYEHANGRIESKSELIDSLVSGRLRYLAIEPSEITIGVDGSMATESARMRLEVVAGDQVHRMQAAYTAVWWLEQGRWQLAAYHSSPLD